MLIIEKRVGETPLEALERLRLEHPELLGENSSKNGKLVTLSYAGRLDPMAEGAMLVLVDEEENRPENRAKFLSLDKEYIATFLVGVKTDTGDCLGLVEQGLADSSVGSSVVRTKPWSIEVDTDRIVEEVAALRNLTKQTYPWFSGKTVRGVKLFDHFKAGNTDIERPEQDIQIKEVEFLGFEKLSVQECKKYITDSVRSVRGDFRQNEILARWEDVLGDTDDDMNVFRVRFVVSSGTFIRSLTEEFSLPTTLFTLRRTKIFM